VIFLIELPPEEPASHTGTVISTNDSKREVTLAIADGTKTENFTGILIDGYRVRRKDGSFHDLIVSEIPPGTKMTIHYFDEMTGPERTNGEVHRIYRLQFLALPPNP